MNLKRSGKIFAGSEESYSILCWSTCKSDSMSCVATLVKIQSNIFNMIIYREYLQNVSLQEFAAAV